MRCVTFEPCKANRRTMSTQNDLTALKQAVTQNPGNGEARYRYGAYLAQTGQYAQAIEEITRALVLQPNLHTARLHLALLHLTSGQTQESLAIVQPLTELSEEDALKHFGTGIQALIESHLPACLQSLSRG